MSSTTTMTAESAMEIPRHPWWLTLINGILAIIIGGILLWAPAKDKVDTWQVLVLALGFYWLFLGIMDIVRIFTDSTGWGWKLFMGIISIVAGGYIIMYPTLAAAVLPQTFVLVLGIWGLLYGIMLIFLGFRGAGWGATIMGVLGVIFGGILVANYTEPGWGLSLLWSAAVIAVIGGIFMIVRSFQEKAAQATQA